MRAVAWARGTFVALLRPSSRSERRVDRRSLLESRPWARAAIGRAAYTSVRRTSRPVSGETGSCREWLGAAASHMVVSETRTRRLRRSLKTSRRTYVSERLLLIVASHAVRRRQTPSGTYVRAGSVSVSRGGEPAMPVLVRARPTVVNTAVATAGSATSAINAYHARFLTRSGQSHVCSCKSRPGCVFVGRLGLLRIELALVTC